GVKFHIRPGQTSSISSVLTQKGLWLRIGVSGSATVQPTGALYPKPGPVYQPASDPGNTTAGSDPFLHVRCPNCQPSSCEQEQKAARRLSWRPSRSCRGLKTDASP
ncbi:hypothetical protein KUCAC02_012223, partial [Chaenocephalus aceratus]